MNLKDKLDKYKKQKLKEYAKELYVVAYEILADSQEMCPVDTGFLRATGNVSEPEFKTDSVLIEIGYNADYALNVHENTTAKHTVGEAKFLEKAFNKHKKKLEND